MGRTLGDNLKRLRNAKQLTQEDLAGLLKHKDRKNSTVSKWERDRDWLPSRRTIAQLCKVLECEPWELFEDAVTPYDRMRVKPVVQSSRSFERRVGPTDRRKAEELEGRTP